jgi:hypothetical protein
VADAWDWSWLPDLSVADRPRTSVTQRWHLPPSTKQLVYFISAVEEDWPNAPVKIGVSLHPLARVAEMQQLSPARLTILAMCDGGVKREKEYHERFAGQRLHGEWFARNEPLMKLIRWHKAREHLCTVLCNGAN